METKCKLAQFQVPPNAEVNLRKWKTDIKPLYDSKKHYRKQLAEFRKELIAAQNLLYAHNRYAVLLIFQGMDAAGKDGAIKHVMSGVNPQGCQVFSFKTPNSEELDHDWLWRTNKRLPERGRIGIFNRSYYEETLIVRVYPEILQGQRLPESCLDIDKIWDQRYQDILNLEDYLHRNGTLVIKLFLHLSKDEQRRRFLSRIDEPDKNWKLTTADLEVRKDWDAFQSAYEQCLARTSSKNAPWHVVPADDKRNARLIVSHAIVESMKRLKMNYPEPTQLHRDELKRARKSLT